MVETRRRAVLGPGVLRVLIKRGVHVACRYQPSVNNQRIRQTRQSTLPCSPKLAATACVIKFADDVVKCGRLDVVEKRDEWIRSRNLG